MNLHTGSKLPGEGENKVPNFFCSLSSFHRNIILQQNKMTFYNLCKRPVSLSKQKKETFYTFTMKEDNCLMIEQMSPLFPRRPCSVKIVPNCLISSHLSAGRDKVEITPLCSRCYNVTQETLSSYDTKTHGRQ